MKKLTLLGVVAVLCLNGRAFGQNNALDIRSISAPLYVGDWIGQNVPLGKVINFKKDTATLSDFNDKLIILSFWFTACPPCVAMLPRENALQTQFSDRIQILPVTYEPEEKILNFINDWEQENHAMLSLPLIVEDTTLRKSFRNLYNPHYVWISPTGKVIAQTSEYFLSAQHIDDLLRLIACEK